MHSVATVALLSCLGVLAIGGCSASGAVTPGTGGTTGSTCASGLSSCNGVCCPATSSCVNGQCQAAGTGTGGDTSTGAAPSTGGSSNNGTGANSTGGSVIATGGKAGTGGLVGTGGTTVPAVTCSEVAVNSGTLTGQYSFTTVPVTGGNKTYGILTNWWNVFSNQTVAYNGNSITVSGNSSSGNSSPAGFPALYIGSYSGRATSGSNLPKQVSSLTTIPTDYETNGASISGQFNAAYDVWFTSSSAALSAGASNPGSGGAYLMVWLVKPTSYSPRGASIGAPVTISGVSGSWNVWWDASASPQPCVSYVNTSNVGSLAFDLNAFIKDAVNRGYLNNSQYLSVVFGGFEIWTGGTGVSATRFCAIVN